MGAIKNNLKAFIILEAKETIWNDINFRYYQYSTKIPNGKQISEGDLLILAKTKKDIKSDYQIYAFCYAGQIIIEHSFISHEIRKVIFTNIKLLRINYKYTDFLLSCGISRNSIKQIPYADLVNTLHTILYDQSN